MLAQEANELGTWPIISELGRVNIAFALKHLLKDGFTLSTSLHRLVNIEVKNAQWRNLLNLSIFSSNKELTSTDF